MTKNIARIVERLRRLVRRASGRHRLPGVHEVAPVEDTDMPTLSLPRIPAVPVVDYDPAPPYVIAYEWTRTAAR